VIEVRQNQIPKRRFDSGDRRHDLFLAMHYIEREAGLIPDNSWEVIEIGNPEPKEAALWSRSVIAPESCKSSTLDI